MSLVKSRKKNLAVVKVSYDSGSDGDVESEEELATGKVNISTQEALIKRKKVFLKKGLAKRKRQATIPDASDGEEEDDDDDTGPDAEEEDEDNAETTPGQGWANAMASILRKKAPERGSAVLAKSKEFAKAKQEEREGFLERLNEIRTKKKRENMSRVMPKATDKGQERALQRIATKGVVQLFNAVCKQQKTREQKLKEVGGSQRKRAKVEASLTKGSFLDMLKGTPAPSISGPNSRTRASSATVCRKTIQKSTSGDQPSWGILRDDFMLGANMKDWDKGEDSNGSDSGGGKGNVDDGDSGLSSDEV